MRGIRWWFTFWGLKARRIGVSRARPLPLHISPGSYRIAGLSFQTAADLESFLLAYKAAHVEVLPSKVAKYEDVASAMRAVQKVGADIGIIGHERK
jgi:hypothetical protein